MEPVLERNEAKSSPADAERLKEGTIGLTKRLKCALSYLNIVINRKPYFYDIVDGRAGLAEMDGFFGIV